MRKVYENGYALYMFSDDIVHVTYKKGVTIDLRAAEQIVKDRMMFQEERAYPVVCDIRQLRWVDKPARDYLAMEGSQLITALAFIIEPPVTDAMMQFYLKTNHLEIPTQSFRDTMKAVAYLGRFLLILIIPFLPLDFIATF